MREDVHDLRAEQGRQPGGGQQRHGADQGQAQGPAGPVPASFQGGAHAHEGREQGGGEELGEVQDAAGPAGRRGVGHEHRDECQAARHVHPHQAVHGVEAGQAAEDGGHGRIRGSRRGRTRRSG